MMNDFKESEFGLIPKAWEYKRLDKVFQIARGGSPRPIKDFITEDSDGYNWIKIGDTKNIDKFIYSTKEKIRRDGLIKSVLVKENDFILSNSMSFGKPYIMKTEGCIHDGWLLLRRINENLSIDFMYYLLSSDFIKTQFKSKAAGSTVQNLNIKLVSTVKALIPSYPEQQKIADILSTVDAKIDVIDQQITETQALKKGLMQRLLTKGIGHTEFKDSPLGKIPKSWEVVKFNEVCFNSSVKYNKPHGKCVELEHIEQQTSRLIGYGEIQDKTSVKSAFSIGDVLFCKLRPYLRKYWKCEFDGGCTSELMVLKPRNNFITDYLFYIIQQDSFIENSVSKSYGTKMPRTSWKILSEYTLGLPSIEEQTRISLIFKTFDDKLEVLSEKKTHYQELKKGLMQQLLTGKIRVKTGVAVCV